MTEIAYKGANCIVLQTKNTTLVVDPVVPGIKHVKSVDKAHVQLATQEGLSVPAVEGQRLFMLPGEYEIGDFSVVGVDAVSQLDEQRKAVVYRITNADCSVAVLGHVNPDSINDEVYEKVGVIDILVLPVGGNGYTIDSHGAAKIVQHMSPKIVIPVHFDDGVTEYDVTQQPIDDFVKELGIQPQHEQTLKIKQSSQLPEVLTLVKLDKTA